MQALAIALIVGIAIYNMWRNHEEKTAAQRKEAR